MQALQEWDPISVEDYLAGELEEYVLVAQDRMEATVFRRAEGWRREVLRQADRELRLASLGFTLPLRDFYEGVQGLSGWP
jgi:Uma2 family endonuclease